MSLKSGTRILAMIAMAFLAAQSVSAEGAVEVRVDPAVRRYIDGVSHLDRTRYFNLAANSSNFWHRCPMGDAPRLLDELRVSLGRGIGLGASAIKTGKPITEDPMRKGFADEASVRAHYENILTGDAELRERFGSNMDLIVHDSDVPHPEFMGSAWKDAGHYQRIGANSVAAADFIALCLKHGFNDFTRPRYYEPLNEPSWQIMQTPQFPALHVELAAAMRREGLDVKIGGPCAPVGYLYNNDYTSQWAKVFKPFIDAAGASIDFISFHIYDYFSGDKAEILTGLPLENTFDLLDAYCLERFGEVKPFACSEHGATGANFNLANVPEKAAQPGFKGVEVPRERLEWLFLNSINGQLMSFLERPRSILKTVPFILDRTDDWNPRYLYTLYSRHGFDKKGEWTRTRLHAFYELWGNVRGERVEAHCVDPDVQVEVFVEGKTGYVCLKNLSNETKPVALRIGMEVVRASRDRLYWGEEGMVFAKAEAVDLGGEWALKPQEMTVVSMEFGEGFKQRGNVYERKFFSGRRIVPIRGCEAEEFRVNMPGGQVGSAGYATLRIGVSRSQSAGREPEVLFNGVRQKVPMERAAEVRGTSAEYVTTKLVAIDPALLRAENDVSVRFPDSGGAIGTLCLRVGFRE